MSQNLPLAPFKGAGVVANNMSHPAQSSSADTPAASVQPPQHIGFRANAQLPGANMSAILQNISPEQLAVIGHLFQTGQLQFPLQLPPASTPSTNNNAPAPASLGVPPPAQPSEVSQGDRMDVEKEEGEWEEEEGAQSPREPDFLRPPPRGPRRRSTSPRHRQGRSGVDSRHSQHGAPTRQTKNVSSPRANGVQASKNNGVRSPASTTQPTPPRQSKRDAAKKFVVAAYRAGFDFDDFAREVGDARPLRSLFQELELRTYAPRRDPVPNAHSNGIVPVSAPSAPSQMNGLRVSLSQTANAAAASAPNSAASKRPATGKPLGAGNREAYLAKLQAAKNKSAGVAAQGSASSPVKLSPSVSAAPAGNASVSMPASRMQANTASSSPAPAPAAQPPRKVNVNNDLVRQRLEALKKDQAQKQLASINPSRSDAVPGVASAASSPHGEQISTFSAQPIQQAVSHSGPTTAPPAAPSVDTNLSPAVSTPNAPFPGLPGLFMTGSPFQAKSNQALLGPGAPPMAPQFQHPASSNPFQQQPPNTAAPRQSAASSATSAAVSPVPAKKPAVSTTASLSNTPVSGNSAPKRTFGRANYDSNDDSLIIQVSDEEESELDEMDEDTDSAKEKTAASTSGKPGNIPNFPPRHKLSAQNGFSMPGTPNAITPGGKAHEQQIEQKLRDIDKMNRRIAEMQKQKSKKTKPNADALVPDNGSAAGGNQASVGGQLPGIAASSQSLSTNGVEPAVPSASDKIPQDAAPATATAPDNTAAQLTDQERNEEIADMEAQLAQLEREAGTSSQQLMKAQAEEPSTAQPLETGAVNPKQAPGDTAASSSSDDAMDVSSEDEDMYDAEELEGRDEADTSPTVLQGASAEAINTTTATSPESRTASDGEYTNIFLNTQDESTTQMSPGRQESILGDASMDDDTDSSSSPSSVSSDSDEEYEPEPAPADNTADEAAATEGTVSVPTIAALPGLGLPPTSTPAVSRPWTNNSDLDLAPELQPSTAERMPSVTEPTTKPRSFFTPYESPLTIFKDYRYHPEFGQNVTGGYKSLTYSNKLNPDQILCPRETTDGECHEQGCEYQHFHGMAVNDNELLKELGTRNMPNKSPEDDRRWKEGLTKVVQQLRASNQGKDVNAIAARIAQFRREFVGKPDKVLSLELP